MWEISGLLSLLEVDWLLGCTWIAWSCWGTPAPGDTQGVYNHYGKSSKQGSAVRVWGIQQWVSHEVTAKRGAIAKEVALAEQAAAAF